MLSPLRVDWCAGGEPPALHPLCGAAPVMWRCTRYVALHPNRRGVMPTDRVRCPSEQVKVWSVCAEVTVLHRGGGLPRTEGRAASHSIHSPLFVSLVIHRG